MCALAPYVQAGAGTKLHKENRKSTFKKIEKKKGGRTCNAILSARRYLEFFFFFLKGRGDFFVSFFLTNARGKCQNVKINR